MLHMAARAWPGAADGSKWLLEPAPEPQLARNGVSSPPRSRKWLEMAARARPGAAEYSTGASRVCPGAAECSTGAARACPGTAECSTGAAQACSGAAACSKSAARAHSHRCVHVLRSKWPLEKCFLLFFYSRPQLLLGSTLLRAYDARFHTCICTGGLGELVRLVRPP